MPEQNRGEPCESWVPLKMYLEAIRQCDNDFDEERDRRYREVAIEKEKAVVIKEKADAEALYLAREIQKYKDEKANELREQIGSERNTYVTKDEMKPLANWVFSQQGRSIGVSSMAGWIFAAATLIIAALAFFRGH
jgi:hypothetical protein